ncbi:MAG: hypothetical protein AAFU85_26355 [Planctomycetota bacterium]
MPRFRLRTLLLIIFVAALVSLSLNQFLVTRPPTQASYSATALSELLADGKTVLVTIDADWAMNPSSRPRYMSPDVSRRVRELNIAMLTANWTKANPSVDALMQSLNQSRVPTLVLFSPQTPDSPIVLPQDPSETEILDALDGKTPAGRDAR